MTAVVALAAGLIAAAVAWCGWKVCAANDAYARRQQEADFERHTVQALTVVRAEDKWTGIDEVQLRREIRKNREQQA